LTKQVLNCTLSGWSIETAPIFLYEERLKLLTKQTKDAENFAIAAAKLAKTLNCKQITVQDLVGKSPATDYFVIATGTSNRQIRTVCDEISALAREMGFPRFGKAGYEQAKWILMDFVDVVVHIFDNEYRDYYDLELLWGDAEKLNWEREDSADEANN